ncbi:hypothetical protein EV368DRAFT_70505, partial [Lentinula lateritia]
KSGIPNTRPRRYLLGITIIILGINTWAYIISVGIELVRLKNVFNPLSNGAGLRAQAEVANAKALPWGHMSIWAANLNLLVGDATVIWRAWAIYTGNRIVQWLLVTLMALNGAILIVSSACDVADLSESLQTTVLALSVTSIWTSLLTNLVATSLIGVKLIVHHKTVKPLYNGKQRSHVERLLLLLVESGTVLGVFQEKQLLYAILLTLEDFTITTQDETAAYLMFSSVFLEVVVNNIPIIILCILKDANVIILVNLERAPLAESFHLSIHATPGTAEFKSPNGPKVAGSIDLAMPPHLSTIRFVEGGDQDVLMTVSSSFTSDHVAQNDLEADNSQI